MSNTTQDVGGRKHVCRSEFDRDLAAGLAQVEYERVADLFDRLTPEQWSMQTDCPGWDVRAMAGHMLGMIQIASSIPELARQQVSATRRAKREGGFIIDSLTRLQIEKNAALTTSELVAAVRATSPKAARNRRRAPGLIRDQTKNEETDGQWTLGYLFDVILTRDPFMHRIDIARATGMPMTITADHEGVIVADVVRDWRGRHGRPFSLELTGPAGGRWDAGGDEPLVLDALEFCRVLSGRAPASGLLTTAVPF